MFLRAKLVKRTMRTSPVGDQRKTFGGTHASDPVGDVPPCNPASRHSRRTGMRPTFKRPRRRPIWTFKCAIR